jgi:hypothetical protein
MLSSCLAVSFCIEIYASGIDFGYGFNPCAPVVGILSFFLLEPQQCSSERDMLDMLPLVGLLWWQLPLFSFQ